MPPLTTEQEELRDAFFESSSLAFHAMVALPKMYIDAKMDQALSPEVAAKMGRTFLPEVAEAFEAEIDKAGCTTSIAFQEKYNDRFLRRVGAKKQTAELAMLMVKSSPIFEEMVNKDPDIMYSFIANPQEFLEKNPNVVVETLNMQEAPVLSRECLANSKLLIADLVKEPLKTYNRIRDGVESFIEERKDIQEEFKSNFTTLSTKYTAKARATLKFLDESKLVEKLGFNTPEVEKFLVKAKAADNLTQDDFIKGMVEFEHDTIPKLVESVSTRMKDEIDGKLPKDTPPLTDNVLECTNLFVKHLHEEALERKDNSISRKNVQEFLSREPSFAGKMLASRISSRLTSFLSSQTQPLVDYEKAKVEQLKKDPDLAKKHPGLETVVSNIELSDIPKIVKAFGGAKKIVSLMLEAREFCKVSRNDAQVNKDAEELSATNIAFNAIMKVIAEREENPNKQYDTHALDEAIALIKKKTHEVKERKQEKETAPTAKKDVKSLVTRFRERFSSLSEVTRSADGSLTPTAVGIQPVTSKGTGRG